MNDKILLVSEKQIKDKSMMNDTVDGKQLSTIISNVQAVKLKAVLGKDLYTTLIDEVEKVLTISGYTLTAQLTELLEDFVIPYLCYEVLVDVLVFNNYKITNKGVMKMNDNSASAVGQGELEDIKKYYTNYLAVYKDRLIQFLRENKLTAPFTDTNVESYSIGWQLDTSKGNTTSDYYENYKHRNRYYTNGY